jgi:citrate lyase subunit beta/citryl-CoA lyase
MRSLLFVPGDSPRKLDKAVESGADVLLLDLEDSVAAGAKEAARGMTADFLRRTRDVAGRPRLYVRVNALGSGLVDADLDAVMGAGPDGILLPKAVGGRDVTHLDAKLAVREAMEGLADGATEIVAIATETAASLFAMGSFQGASRRLRGMTWGAEDLSADLGAARQRNADGSFTDAFRLARALCLVGAVAAGVAPIDGINAAFRDLDALAAEAEAAALDGFTGKLAIHPAQVPVINAAFTPSPAAVARAQAVLAAFAAAGPGAGVVSLDGAMLDQPHRLQAERLLARARGAGVAT